MRVRCMRRGCTARLAELARQADAGDRVGKRARGTEESGGEERRGRGGEGEERESQSVERERERGREGSGAR